MAEGGGLLNRCTGSTRTVSSNLIPSANFIIKIKRLCCLACVNPRFDLRVGSWWVVGLVMFESAVRLNGFWQKPAHASAAICVSDA